MNNVYSLAWFQERAFNSIKEIDKDSWDYSDSLLIYPPRAEDKYETIQQADNPYYKLVTEPEREYIQKIAPAIAEMLPKEFEYVDLGPGTEHKEQYIFDALKNLYKHFTYRPVDIDEKYLELATKHAQQQDIPTVGLHSSFEELPEKLSGLTKPRFVSIGLTYTNYAPKTILQLLKSIAGKGGYIFINSQIRERVDMPELVKVYTQEVFALMEPKIRLLGLDPNSDISEHWCDDGIRAWCSLKNSTQRLQQKGIGPGSKLMTYYFLRPSLESLQNDILANFPQYKLLDMDEPFVGGLLFTSKDINP